jgi:fructose-1,6-bisphosphatase
MSKAIFLYASAQLASARKHLGLDIHDAFTNFSQRIVTGSGYARSTIALDMFDERVQKRETP